MLVGQTEILLMSGKRIPAKTQTGRRLICAACSACPQEWWAYLNPDTGKAMNGLCPKCRVSNGKEGYG